MASQQYLLRKKNEYTAIAKSSIVNRTPRGRDKQSLRCFACSVGYGTTTDNEMLLKPSELDALIVIVV